MDRVTLAKAYSVQDAKQKAAAAKTLLENDRNLLIDATGVWETTKGELVFLFRPAEVVKISVTTIDAVVDGATTRLRIPDSKPKDKFEIPCILFGLVIA